MSLSDEIRGYAQELGFALVGFTSAQPLSEAEEAMLRAARLGYLEGMPWMNEQRMLASARPTLHMENAATIISLASSYLVSRDDVRGAPGKGRVARYAWGTDYHRYMHEGLRALQSFISARGAPCQAKACVDSGWLAERALARRAGIGWIGKNANVLTPSHGSWVLLAELMVSIELEFDAPLLKSCGSCQRCLVACPTGALVAPHVLDARRCISYLTIENRGPIPLELRPLLGDRVFGCDICQEVCPVNRKAALTERPEAAPLPFIQDGSLDLYEIMAMDERAYHRRFRGTAVWRATYPGLLRNAAVVLGNSADEDAVPALARRVADAPALVRGHAAWALGRIGGRRARAALEQARRSEADPEVSAEIAAALHS